MNYVLFILKSALEDFRRNKMRTFLTSLGILIGVASVILLISFGLGLKKYIQNQFESLGTNLVIIFPGQILQGGGFRSGGGSLGGARFDEKDVLNLKKIKPNLFVVPMFIKTITVSGEGNSAISDLYATTADMFPVRNLEIDKGNFFDKGDVEKRSKKVVIGSKIAEKVFGSADSALSRIIKIENQGFRVSGVLKSKGRGGFGGPDFDSFIYLPYKSAYSFNPDKKFVVIYLQAKSPESIPSIKKEIKNILLKRYKEDDFSVIEQTEILKAVSSIFGVLNIVLVAIAGISLVVGGIGIMNIMYVSVIEKIREIGIRRAIGATRSDILFQFLAESVILSLIGGLAGLIFSFIIVIFIQRFFPAYINIQTIAIALGVSSFIGIIFGVFPARRASKLSPIDAIRYE
ncbi:MAG TPA: ABC transporter permease [Patescibacteria group bacterium]|nr:ABC transporter permease [Patescibacteria group bacterium]